MSRRCRCPRSRSSWARTAPARHQEISQRHIPPLEYLIWRFTLQRDPGTCTPEAETEGPPSKEDIDEILGLDSLRFLRLERPFAGAPVRSRPRRTYDPSHTIEDPEGEYIPMLLANIQRRNSARWKALKSALEEFGKDAGLFDEVDLKVLGGKSGGPFQLQVRKGGKGLKGPWKNIIDVGYGVSQVLPVVTELLRPDGPQVFLLQQPEVHLHPSAQATLGALLGRIAEPRRTARQRRQVLVETHSDHLIDRVRMDVRDERSGLKPEDVSLLYFERRALSVTIHPLGWDANGNLVIPGSRKAPERIVRAVNRPERQIAQAVAFAWLDTRAVRSPESRAYAILNDSDRPVSQQVLAAIRSYDVSPVVWSEREIVRPELAA